MLSMEKNCFHLNGMFIFPLFFFFSVSFWQTNPVTLTRFIMEETEADHIGRISMAFIFQSIAVASKVRLPISEKKVFAWIGIDCPAQKVCLSRVFFCVCVYQFIALPCVQYISIYIYICVCFICTHSYCIFLICSSFSSR